MHTDTDTIICVNTKYAFINFGGVRGHTDRQTYRRAYSINNIDTVEVGKSRMCEKYSFETIGSYIIFVLLVDTSKISY